MDRFAKGRKLDSLISKMSTSVKEEVDSYHSSPSSNEDPSVEQPAPVMQAVSSDKGEIVVRNGQVLLKCDLPEDDDDQPISDNREARRSLLDTYLYPSSPEEERNTDCNMADIVTVSMSAEPNMDGSRFDSEDGNQKVVCKYHNGRWTCSECGRSYNFPSSFYRHRRRMHPSGSSGIISSRRSSSDHFDEPKEGMSSHHVPATDDSPVGYLDESQHESRDSYHPTEAKLPSNGVTHHQYDHIPVQNEHDSSVTTSPDKLLQEDNIDSPPRHNNGLSRLSAIDGVGPKLCPVCGRSFSCVSSRNRHMRDIHNFDKLDIQNVKSPQKFTGDVVVSPRPQYGRVPSYSPAAEHIPCPHCDLIVDSEAKLVAHMKCHIANIQETTHSCSWCGVKVAGISALEAHEKMSHKILYNCGSCNRSFGCRTDMVSHLKTNHLLANTEAQTAIHKAQDDYHVSSATTPLARDCIPIVNVCIDDMPTPEYHGGYPLEAKTHATNRKESQSGYGSIDRSNGLPLGGTYDRKHIPSTLATAKELYNRNGGVGKHEPQVAFQSLPLRTVDTAEYSGNASSQHQLPAGVKPITRSIAYDGKILYECNQCDRKFKRKFYFDYHLEQHREVKVKREQKTPEGAASSKNICPICNSAFSTLQLLEHHCQSHFNDEEVHSCSVCTKSFSSMANLRRHVRLAHELQSPDRHHLRLESNVIRTVSSEAAFCDHCNKHFSNTANLKRHNAMVHKAICY